jgi:hypothetical protein
VKELETQLMMGRLVGREEILRRYVVAMMCERMKTRGEGETKQ